MKAHVLLYPVRNWVGRLIGWQTRSNYAHVAFLLDNRVYEAEYRQGVICRPPSEADSVAERYSVELSDSDHEKLIQWCDVRVGLGYDWLAILRFVSRRRHDGWLHAYFCSEFVAEGLAYVGRPLQRAEPWKISPALVGMSLVLEREAG